GQAGLAGLGLLLVAGAAVVRARTGSM
ncbi:MAG: hypothetical protein JWN57_1287, partial [Frankiales bacterium]|nr:hypothetical protein [Frankiales bacterium]